jgi:hypothetical protein
MALAFVLLLPAVTHAQDFGVMNSAETINRGNFKLAAYPLLVFGEGGADNNGGFVFLGGYGLTDNLDVEAKLGVFDEVTFFGGDVEYWLIKDRPWDLSLGGGFHVGRSDFVDETAVDITILGSGHVTPLLEIFGALDLAFQNFDVDGGFDDDATTAHLVPGIEYKLSDNLDLIAELGVGLNDSSANYIAGGVAYYLR